MGKDGRWWLAVQVTRVQLGFCGAGRLLVLREAQVRRMRPRRRRARDERGRAWREGLFSWESVLRGLFARRIRAAVALASLGTSALMPNRLSRHPAKDGSRADLR